MVDAALSGAQSEANSVATKSRPGLLREEGWACFAWRQPLNRPVTAQQHRITSG